MVHTYNLHYVEDGDEGNQGLMPAWAKKIVKPYINQQGGVCTCDPS